MDRGAWGAMVLGVTESQTQLSDFHFLLPPLKGRFCNYKIHLCGKKKEDGQIGDYILIRTHILQMLFIIYFMNQAIF